MFRVSHCSSATYRLGRYLWSSDLPNNILVPYVKRLHHGTHNVIAPSLLFSARPDWKSGMSVPLDIAVAYLIQGSFYGHSIYATVYMDAWRKDSAVMVVHHIITLALICFSYAFRYLKPPLNYLLNIFII